MKPPADSRREVQLALLLYILAAAVLIVEAWLRLY